MASASIMSLLQWSCPAAVVGFVIASGVGPSIKSFTGWAFAHVCQKVLKTVVPPITNEDAFTVMISAVDPPTALFHAVPTVICWGPAFRGLTMSSGVCVVEVTAAAAALSLSTSQAVDCNNGLSSAIAAATPMPFLIGYVGEMCRYQKAKALASEVHTGSHVRKYA